MKIRFDEAEYTLADNHVNVSPDHFQALLDKGDHTIDDIISDVDGVEEIQTIEEDGVVTGVYRGYSEIIAITTYDGINVSVELLNKNIQSQIDTLSGLIKQVEELQSNQAGMLDQVTTVANDLVNSQATQDLAIEDLAEAVSDLTPEEE